MTSQGNPKTSDVEAKLAELRAALNDDDGLKRREARLALVRMHHEATPFLVKALKDDEQQLRWEAAKALIEIQDPQAASALVAALNDDSFEIRWLAAEALIALGPESIKPLLQALIDRPDDFILRQGAHHVLHDLERKGSLNDETTKLLDDLRSIETLEPLSLVAKRALQSLGG